MTPDTITSAPVEAVSPACVRIAVAHARSAGARRVKIELFSKRGSLMIAGTLRGVVWLPLLGES